MPIWIYVFGAIAAYANYHYWFVLTPEQRALSEDDEIDLQFW